MWRGADQRRDHDETELATRVSTTWHSPAAGPGTLWLVLRDSRGGIASRTVQVEVAS
jgi:hypothetical protein